MKSFLPQEYKKLLGIPVFAIIEHFFEASILYYPIYFTCMSAHSLYRHSTLFKKFRFKDNRHFIQNKLDKPKQKNKLIYGLGYLSLGVIYYLLEGKLGFEEFTNIVIKSSLITLGLENIISKLFLKPLPVLEILFRNTKVEILENGKIIEEFYRIDSFVLSQERVFIKKGNKETELGSLNLTEKQLSQIYRNLEGIRQITELNQQTRRNTVSAVKKRLSGK